MVGIYRCQSTNEQAAKALGVDLGLHTPDVVAAHPPDFESWELPHPRLIKLFLFDLVIIESQENTVASSKLRVEAGGPLELAGDGPLPAKAE